MSDRSAVLAVLYDIHGNLPALDAVLSEARAVGADRWLLGGDYAAFGPWPKETLEQLRGLDNAVWLRGNAERWLVDPPAREEVQPALSAARAALTAADVDWLVGLPTLTELDGVFFCHGSPLSDVDSFAPDADGEDERLLAGVHDQVVVFGHSHVQFGRPGLNGTELVNPGSVGMPLDGDVRAAWALRQDQGEFEFRRTKYDVERAVAKARELGDWADQIVTRLERGSD